MTTTFPLGWGKTPWGRGPWGTGLSVPLQLVSAVAVRENAVRLQFNVTPLYTGTFDLGDASDPQYYNVQNDPTTTGMDGQPCRPVNVGQAVLVTNVPDSFGTLIDVEVDRPFSPFPGRYTVSCIGLIAFETMAPLDPAHRSLPFLGVAQGISPATPADFAGSRDIANPMFPAELAGYGYALSQQVLKILGTIPIDSTGDYATDNQQVNLRKRILRRLFTRKGGFAHLGPGYGVGLLARIKKASKASDRADISTDATQQIKQEPGVVDAQVVITSDPSGSGLWYVNVRVKTLTGNDNFSFALPSGP